MVRKSFKKWGVAAMSIALATAANPAQAGTIITANNVTLTTGGLLDKTLLSADNLKFGGKTYSVSFGDQLTSIAFGTSAAAAVAAQALLDDVFVNVNLLNLFDSLPGLTNGCVLGAAKGDCTVYVPYSLSGNKFDGAFALNQILTDSTGLVAAKPVSSVNSANATFANFTEVPSVSSAVPEPSTWALMLAGFAMTGFALRRGRAGDRRVAFA